MVCRYKAWFPTQFEPYMHTIAVDGEEPYELLTVSYHVLSQLVLSTSVDFFRLTCKFFPDSVFTATVSFHNIAGRKNRWHQALGVGGSLLYTQRVFCTWIIDFVSAYHHTMWTRLFGISILETIYCCNAITANAHTTTLPHKLFELLLLLLQNSQLYNLKFKSYRLSKYGNLTVDTLYNF